MTGFPPRSRRLRRGAVGLVLGVALLVAYLRLTGVGGVVDALGRVSPGRAASLLLVGAAPVVCWGLGLHLVLGRLDRPVRATDAVLLFSATGFLNAVTPFGQAGGDPVSALLLRRAVGTDFETGLAAIGSVNALNRVATVVLGLLGAGYLGSRIAGGGSLREMALLTATSLVVGALAVAVAWRFRRRLVAGFAAAAAPPARLVGRAVPTVSPPTRTSLAARGSRFVDALDRLAADPRRLSAVFALSVAGQVVVATTLLFALSTVGFDAPFVVLLLVVPVAKLSGAAPTPGGLGTAEVLLGTLLVSTTGVDAATAGAAVLLYRACAFWAPSLLGGVVTGWFVGVGGVRPTEGGGTGAMRREAAGTADASAAAVPRLLVAVAAAVAAATLLVVAVHRGRLLAEPPDPIVHLVRDAALCVAAALVAWAGVERLPSSWFE